MKLAPKGIRPVRSFAAGLSGLALLTSTVAAQAEFVVPAGTTVQYNTEQGPLVVTRLVIESGATLRATGQRPLKILALAEVQIDGTLDVSGFDAPSVSQITVPNIPKQPGPGGPGGGAGGTGSPTTTGSSAAGTMGLPGALAPSTSAGGGGHSGFSDSPISANRRPAGGGGGRLAADLAIVGSPFDAANWGLVALPGQPGAPTATDAMLFTGQPAGGVVGTSVFTDTNPDNNFFGARFDPFTLGIEIGELRTPVGGSGGGAGGDSIQSSTFPAVPWLFWNEYSGAGGGGGGGVAVVRTRRLAIGPTGKVLANGGVGGRGEVVAGLNVLGGAGGGGSGGMLVLEATDFDFSQAGTHCLSARGGRGGPGFGAQFAGAMSEGGNGGPGLIQLHTFDASTAIQLPIGQSLADLSVPEAKVLLPLP